MLILIGTVPTAYALNHAVGFDQVQDFAIAIAGGGECIRFACRSECGDWRCANRIDRLHSHQRISLRTRCWRHGRLSTIRAHEVLLYKSLGNIPAADQANVRNDMYVTDEALRMMAKSHVPAFSAAENEVLASYQQEARWRDEVHSDMGEEWPWHWRWAWAR